MASKQKPSFRELERRKAAGTLTGQEQAYLRLSPGTTRALIEDDFSDWDDEELAEGRRRAKDGSFKGPKPYIIPAGVVREHARRVNSQGHRKLRESLQLSIDVLTELVTGQDVDDNVRLKAIEIIMNRVMGRPDVQVDVSVKAAPWQGLLATSIVSLPPDESDIIDAEVVEDD